MAGKWYCRSGEKSFLFFDASSFKKLFCIFVHPHLECAQSVWAPHLQRQIDTIKNVQKRTTRLADGLERLDYGERLKTCFQTMLHFRRIRGDIIDMWKHFIVYDKEILPPAFIRNERPVRNGRHQYQIYQRIPCDGQRGTHFRKLWRFLKKNG